MFWYENIAESQNLNMNALESKEAQMVMIRLLVGKKKDLFICILHLEQFRHDAIKKMYVFKLGC